jgi:hypothetical protein
MCTGDDSGDFFLQRDAAVGEKRAETSDDGRIEQGEIVTELLSTVQQRTDDGGVGLRLGDGDPCVAGGGRSGAAASASGSLARQ